MIDQIIEYNKTFVAQKGYKSHPLVPKDIAVCGFITDSEAGKMCVREFSEFISKPYCNPR